MKVIQLRSDKKLNSINGLEIDSTPLPGRESPAKASDPAVVIRTPLIMRHPKTHSQEKRSPNKSVRTPLWLRQRTLAAPCEAGVGSGKPRNPSRQVTDSQFELLFTF